MNKEVISFVAAMSSAASNLKAYGFEGDFTHQVMSSLAGQGVPQNGALSFAPAYADSKNPGAAPGMQNTAGNFRS